MKHNLFTLVIAWGCITFSCMHLSSQNEISSPDQFNFDNFNQGSQSGDKSHQDLGLSSQQEKENRYNQQSHIRAKDSVYYAHIVKQNGWFVGIGKKLSPREITHMSCVYKLSRKNAAGHWTLIEAFDGYGKPTTNHTISSYLVNQFDDSDMGINANWKEKLLSVCKWEFISDVTGNVVIQEKALNADGSVVYIYAPVQIGACKFSGCYTDEWGMPIFIRTDSLGNDAGFANVVHITRDNRGYEVLYAYTDRFGYPQKNKDGAYMTQKGYDDKGHQIMEASLNILGEKMIDDFGNCGWEHHYYDTYEETYYYDENWQRIKMPETGRSSNEGVYGYRIFNDNYGRDTAICIIDQFGNPASNKYGIHKYMKKYDGHGNQILFATTDISGHLIAESDESLAALYESEYDKNGNRIFLEIKDANGDYVNYSSDGWCIEKDSFNQNNICLLEIDYRRVNEFPDSLVKKFEFHRDAAGNSIRIWYDEDMQRIDSVDSKGRDVLLAWYDLNNTPIENDGLHKQITIFDDEHGVEINQWLDKDGQPYIDEDRGYSKDICISDSTTNIMTNYQYYYKNLLKQAFQKQYSAKFDTILAQWDITPYGEHARVGWWNNLHYICKVDYTMYGNIRTMVGYNEFNEPAYLTFLGSSGEVYYFSDLNNGQRRYYNEFGHEIPSNEMEAFKDTLPRVFCIEVTDTTIAYPVGLRNGDIIISYGDWTSNEDLRTNVDYFYLETILKANQAKSITIMRHHPEDKRSEIINLNLPIGRTSDLGFYPHKIYYTQKEKTRLLETCSLYGKTLIFNKMKDEEATIILAVETKGELVSTRLYHLPMYNIKDPGIVLYAKEEWSNGCDTWSLKQSLAEWESLKMFYISNSNLYITQDLYSYRHINKSSEGYGGMKFIPLKISQSVYQQAFKCYENLLQTNRDISFQENSNDINIKKNQLCGRWEQSVAEEDNIYHVQINFNKNNTAKVVTSILLNVEIQDNVYLQLISTITYPKIKWEINGYQIKFLIGNSKPVCTLIGYDVDCENENTRNEILEKVLNNEAALKDSLIDSYGIEGICGGQSLEIMELKQNEFYIKGHNENPFVRMLK